MTWHGPAVLRDGNWLTAWRVRVYAALILVGGVAGLCVMLAASQGGLDPQGRPVGTDFSHMYGAGTLVREGHAADERPRARGAGAASRRVRADRAPGTKRRAHAAARGARAAGQHGDARRLVRAAGRRARARAARCVWCGVV